MDRRSLLNAALMIGSMAGCMSGAIAHAIPVPVRTEASTAEQLEALPNWTTDGQRLTCTFEFANFVESVAFVNRLVEPAEALGHHPDLYISYNRVTVSLTTHDAGGLTPLDFAVAGAIAQPCPPPSP